MVTENNNIKTKLEMDRKINFYSRCTDCGFKKSEAFDKKELSHLCKV